MTTSFQDIPKWVVELLVVGLGKVEVSGDGNPVGEVGDTCVEPVWVMQGDDVVVMGQLKNRSGSMPGEVKVTKPGKLPSLVWLLIQSSYLDTRV